MAFSPTVTVGVAEAVPLVSLVFSVYIATAGAPVKVLPTVIFPVFVTSFLVAVGIVVLSCLFFFGQLIHFLKLY